MSPRRVARTMRGVLVHAHMLRHAYGDRVTLDGVSFELGARVRVALTGRNGAGKTTLLRVILGQLKPDSGDLEFNPGLRVGSLEQDPMYAPGLSVADVIRAALGHVRDLENRLRTLEGLLETQPSATLEYSETLEAFERAGGYSAESRAGRVLSALRLTEFLEREAVTLSGGERTRLSLACALCDQPDLLVLDEPTNHLDIGMREWLEGMLRDYPGAVLVVSHDRALLDAVANETWHLDRGKLTRYRGGYSKARAQRLEERRVRQRQNKLGTTEIRRLESASNRVATWGRNNDKLAKRAKAIEKRAERARDTLVEAPTRERKIAMSLESGNARARVIVRAEHVFKTYGHRRILEDANLRVRAGDRIALIAPNGVGKTTFLRILLGDLAPDALEQKGSVPNDLDFAPLNKGGGELASRGDSSSQADLAPDAPLEPLVRFSDGVQPAYFDQTYHGLKPGAVVFGQLSARVGDAGAKALLGRYGFRVDDWPKMPKELSGGERARAGLALIAATRADLLVLDEPTNHLDVEALESLEEALHAYPGSVLFVTHDRAFARAVATRVLTIHDGHLLEFADGFDGYERFRRGDQRESTSTLDPGRLFDDEIEAPAPPVPDPMIELARLEERLNELDATFLRGGLTNREYDRLKLEESRSLARLFELYGLRWVASVTFDYAIRSGPLQVCANAMGDAWHFTAVRADGCPALVGKLEGNVFYLAWLESESTALDWYRSRMLLGAARIAFEHLGAQSVIAPPGDERGLSLWTGLEHDFRTISSAEYAGALGLIRPPASHPKKLVFHPDFADWARARRFRRARKSRNTVQDTN
jgi:ATPase subunit of ABC transporter with duplicated ATPase domains